MKFRNISHTILIVNRLFYRFLGYTNYLNLLWWGIKFETIPKFIGKCYFRKYPNSKIIIGKNCTFLSRRASNLIGINRNCIISTLTEDAVITIGNNCGFSGTVIGAFNSIRIGNNVKCGANILITDSDWHPEDYRSQLSSPIIIEDNVWLGEGVKVLKGVKIGKNAVIGAGSVVTKNIPANVVAAGNPCRIIKEML